MKLVLISDTHGKHREVSLPDGDVLIHAGDSTMMGYRKESNDFHEWFCNQPHENKILIPGNHDFNWERDYKEGGPPRYIVSNEVGSGPGYHYLLDSGVVIDGVKFWGSPWTPLFGGWAFMLPRGETIKHKWNLIPSNTDVLIAHGPPMGMLDQPWGGMEHVGCEELLDRVFKVEPKINVFGHIHGSYGRKHFGCTEFVNASIVGEDYKVQNAPVVLEI